MITNENDRSKAPLRRTIEITFSKQFESQLLNYPSEHISLTHDLEFHIERGLRLFEQLQDVYELTELDTLKQHIIMAHQNSVMESGYFSSWQITLSEDLLDAIDLIILMHGEDLMALGVNEPSSAHIIVLLATASLNTQSRQIISSSATTYLKLAHLKTALAAR